MRMDRRDAVEYLLNRGLNPLSSDDAGKTAVHYAIEFQSMSMLCYLCEGVWESAASLAIRKGQPAIYPAESPAFPPWVLSAWSAIDYAATPERLVPLHFCAIIDSLYVLKYVVYILNLRVKLKGANVDFLRMGDMIELRSKSGLTPLLLAAQHAKNQNFEYFVSLGANLRAVTSKMQNALHLAVIDKNENMIKMIGTMDEEGWLRRQVDYRGRRPLNYDRKGEYKVLMISVWEAIRESRLGDIQSVVEYYEEKFSENPLTMRAKADGNTPLHYAILVQNVEAVRVLLELEADPIARNNAGLTPAELLEKAVTNPDLKAKLAQALSTAPARSVSHQTARDLPAAAPQADKSKNPPQSKPPPKR